MGDKIDLLMTDSGFKPVEPEQKGPVVTFNPIENDPNAKPLTSKQVAEKSMMNWLGSDMQNFSSNAQIKPYTYDASQHGSAFYERYKAYGNETFDRIGFSPFKNNDKEFNAGTSAMSEYGRAMTNSIMPLFANGFKSSVKSLGRMMGGDFGDDPKEAYEYARAAAIGNSTKGGFVGFTNNLGVSFAYTAGIITEAITEEIAGLALSPLIGPESALFTTSRLLSNTRKAAKGLEGLKMASNVTEAAFETGKVLKDLSKINKTRELFAASKTAEKVASTGKKFVNFINPLSNTTDAIGSIIRNDSKLAGLAKMGSNTSRTVGALYSDIRNINMALSEARLEGGFIRNDFYKERVDEYRKSHNGEMPDEATLDLIKTEAAEASQDGMLSNTLLIFASNKVSFNNIMNPKRGITALLNKNLSTIKKNIAGKTVREFTTKTLKTGAKVLTPKLSWVERGWKGFKGTAQSLKKQGFQKVALKTIGYTKVNLMEGVQESLQDVIANTSKDYHKQAFYSEPVAANLFTKAELQLLLDKRTGGKMFRDAFGKQFTWEGAETFLSGFAMGALAHPLNQALPFVLKTKQKIFNKEQYKADKEYLNNYSKKMVESVNTTFENDPLKYFNTRLFGLGEQVELNKVIESGTTKEELDAKNESTIKQVTNLIEMDSVDAWLDHLEALKQLTPEEYAEMMSSTEEETQNYVEKLDVIINKTKEIEKQYKDVNDKMPNPINLKNYEKGTVDYEKASIYYSAWEEGKKGIIFYKETFKDTVMRMQSVFQDAASNKLIGKIDPNKVQLLFKESRLDSEINSIENELTSLKGLDDDYSKKQFKEKTQTLGALKEFKADYSEFMNHFYYSKQKADTKEKDYVEEEIIANAPSKKDNRSERKIKDIKLKSFEQRSNKLEETDTNDASAIAYKEKSEALTAELTTLKSRRDQLQSPEYYEIYIKDSQFSEKELESINRKIVKLEKDQEILNNENNDRSEVRSQNIVNKLEGSFKSYMKILAKQSDDIILDGNIDESFEKLVDYYRLGEESFKLSDAVNMLTDPSGFIDHVERTYEWMSDSWNNREEEIKKNINNQLERLKYNQLLNEMASRGIYLDLDEFADFKEFGTIPTEFFDAINKRVIKSGSPIYEQLITEFYKLSAILEFTEGLKSSSEKLNDTILRLNNEEQDELNKLIREAKRVKIRNIDNSKPFSIQVIADQLGIDQYVEATYNDGTVKTQIYFKDNNGVLRFDDVNGEPVNLKAKGEEGKIKFDSAEIFSIVEAPNEGEAKIVREKYDELRAQAAEESVEETSKPFVPTEAAPVVEITADTLVEDMPTDLRVQLVDAYDAYRANPKNKSLFPDTLTEEDLRNKFQTYIKSEPEALEIIETYLKEQKLKTATEPSGDVIVPMITLPNGKTVSADEVDDAALQGSLKRYRFLISEMNNKDASKLSPQEREDFAKLKIKANILSAYIENKRVKEMSPELQKAQVIIDQLQKEQEKITPMPTGYDVEGAILRRVSNVIAGLKGSVYQYGAMDGSMDEIRALYNQTIGAGLSVDDFVQKIIEAKLPGFNMWSTKDEDTYNFDKFKADIEAAIADESTQPSTDAEANVERRRQYSIDEINRGFIGEATYFGPNWNPSDLATIVENTETVYAESKQEAIDKINKLYAKELAALGTTETSTTEVAVTYASLLDNARTQQSQGQNKPLNFLFFGNLENALRSNIIKSKAELNDIISVWDEQAAYNGNPNRMTELQGSKLAKLSESLPETTPVTQTTTTTEVSKPSVLEAVEALVTEKTYEENRVGGNYIDAQGKLFFNGEKPVFDPKKITKEAFDALYGDNGLFQIVQQWIDTNDLIIVSKGLVVYDKQANVAGEIDLLLVNKKGEFFIVDLKTGSKSKWENYNTPGSSDNQKKIENTYQQGAYVNLLYNMFGIKAIPKIFPIEVFLDSTTGKVIKASKPTSSTALKPGKILIDLDITKEMQDKLDEIIPPTTPSVSAVPLSASVEKIVGEKVPEPIEKSVSEEDAKLSDTVLKLKAEIDKADFDKLQMIELNFGMKALTMTAEEVFQVQDMLDSRRALLTSGETVVMQEKSYTTGDEVFAESVIFAEKGKNKGEVFLQPYEVATIVKINFTANTVTIRPVGRKNEMTVPMETLDKTFKLKSEVTTEKVEETKTTTEDKILVEESNDIVSILTNDKVIQSKLEKEADAIGSVDDTLNELLEDLDC